jgi:ammonia channel protein AmtB
MPKNFLAFLALPVSLAFIVLAVWYWTTPAGMLPSFFPGFIDGSSVIHYKHGIAFLLLGFGCLAYAWFATGKKR